MGWFPYMPFETCAVERRYLVLQYYIMVIIAYTQQVLEMEALFGT